MLARRGPDQGGCDTVDLVTAEPDTTVTADLQRTTLRVLVVSNVLVGVGVASGIAVIGLLAEDISGSTSLSGLGATSLTLGAALLAVPLARLARLHGRRVSLSVGYLIALTGALLCIVAAQADSFALLLLAGCMFGSGTATSLQARYAATDAAEPGHVARALSVVVWATTIGVVLGPNLTGVGATVGTTLQIDVLAGPFAFSVVAFGLGLIVVWSGLRRLQRARPVRGEQPARQPLTSTFREVLAIPPARLGLVAIAVAHAVMVGVMSMTSVHLRHHGASLTVVGIVISGHVAGMFGLSPVMGSLADAVGRIRTTWTGLVILATSMLIIAVAPDDAHGVTGLALVLLGLGWSACLVSGSALLSQSVPADIRTSAQGMSDLTMGVLATVSGTAAGPVLGAWGFDWLAILCGVLLLPVALLAARTPAIEVAE